MSDEGSFKNLVSEVDGNTLITGEEEEHKLLAWALKKLIEAKYQLELAKKELGKAQGCVQTFREFFEEKKNREILDMLDKTLRDTENFEYNGGLFAHASNKMTSACFGEEDVGLLKPPLSEIKNIAYKIVRKGAIPSTSRLREEFNNEGYSVNLNSLRTILSQSKESFKFDPSQGGWILAQKELAVAS